MRRRFLRGCSTDGGIAQLGERLNGIQEVSGSIPLISTTIKSSKPLGSGGFYFFQIFGKLLQVT